MEVKAEQSEPCRMHFDQPQNLNSDLIMKYRVTEVLDRKMEQNSYLNLRRWREGNVASYGLLGEHSGERIGKLPWRRHSSWSVSLVLLCRKCDKGVKSERFSYTPI
jgi:hypothetical protein